MSCKSADRLVEAGGHVDGVEVTALGFHQPQQRLAVLGIAELLVDGKVVDLLSHIQGLFMSSTATTASPACIT